MKISIGLLLAVATCSQAFSWRNVDTVKELDLKKYAGRWFEIYGSLIQKWTFQRNTVCVTADYTLRPDGKVTVFNSGRVKKPDGPSQNITGEATQPNAKEPGKLTVQFPRTPKGNYWVVKLGPVINDQYQYTIITVPYKAFLWVLARDVKEFRSKYDKEVKKYLKENGFTWFWNYPRPTLQSDDCIYSPEP